MAMDDELYDGVFLEVRQNTDKLQAKLQKAEDNKAKLTKAVKKLKAKVSDLEREREVLAMNLSTVFNTAKLEMARKTQQLDILNRQMNQSPTQHRHKRADLHGRGMTRGVMRVPRGLGGQIILPHPEFELVESLHTPSGRIGIRHLARS
eukprot:TRINITY_DN4836_c0_g1_i3.p1 TRINITY_DN4836_c0_g1~~TRINITY_DN4836_c0_g1_i3.p1  ORF type:complete len:149 (+),score=44.30 TRINITY_DN4836_c0_g1_i3:247-693(+)